MTTKQTHTKGPWKWERIESRRKVFMPGDYMLVGDSGRMLLGFCASAFQAEAVVPEGCDAANARLIAAAPDLLTALQAAMDDAVQNDNQLRPETVAQIANALARVEGGR